MGCQVLSEKDITRLKIDIFVLKFFKTNAIKTFVVGR